MLINLPCAGDMCSQYYRPIIAANSHWKIGALVTNKYLATYLMTISGSVAAIELLEDLVAGKSKQIGPESEFCRPVP